MVRFVFVIVLIPTIIGVHVHGSSVRMIHILIFNIIPMSVTAMVRVVNKIL